MIPISPFVLRCREAMDEYSRLKAQGYSHQDAHRLSRMAEAITGKLEPPFDVKRAQAGKDTE